MGKFVDQVSKRMPHASLSLLESYHALSLVCRQFYIDIVGSGSLYRFANFFFIDRFSLSKYVLNINPFHTSVIRSVKLQLAFDASRPEATIEQPMEVLAKLESLEFLELKVYNLGLLHEIMDPTLWEPMAGKVKKLVVEFSCGYLHVHNRQEMEDAEAKIMALLLN
jgi:hypothetical protein